MSYIGKDNEQIISVADIIDAQQLLAFLSGAVFTGQIETAAISDGLKIMHQAGLQFAVTNPSNAIYIHGPSGAGDDILNFRKDGNTDYEVFIGKGGSLREIANYSSSVNGAYVRFYNGAQICVNQVTHSSLAVTTGSGGSYASAEQPDVTYPAAFTSLWGAASVIAGSFNGGRWLATNGGGPGSTTAWEGYHIMDTGSSTSTTYVFQVAFGAWY